MAPISVENMNPQLNSPLFSQIPPEVRNSIFEYALTAYDDTTRRYRKNAYYHRPGFTCAHKVDIALLSTCRRVYSETVSLPDSINGHVGWFYRGPPELKESNIHHLQHPGQEVPDNLLRLRKIHIFAQQFWLEENSTSGRGFSAFLCFWDHVAPPLLKITIRHPDWWWWEIDAPLALDPKHAGRPSPTRQSRPSDPFEPDSWGAQFRHVSGLQTLQLELETVESKAQELDALVRRAKDWRFPLGDGNMLVLDESKTRRTGWVGVFLDWNSNELDYEDGFVAGDHEVTLPENFRVYLPSALSTWTGHLQSDESDDEESSATPEVSLTARQRLEATGVVFDHEDLVKGLPADMSSTYYVVTLTWQARRC